MVDRPSLANKLANIVGQLSAEEVTPSGDGGDQTRTAKRNTGVRLARWLLLWIGKSAIVIKE